MTIENIIEVLLKYYYMYSTEFFTELLRFRRFSFVRALEIRKHDDWEIGSVSVLR
jgi:hypothetical protein